MNYFAAILATICALAVAITIDRLLCFIRLRVKEDIPRSNAAIKAMTEQQYDLSKLLAIESVDKEIKLFILNLSETALEKHAANIIIHCMKEGPFAERREPTEVDDLLNRISKLEHSNKQAFDICTRLLRRMIPISVLQWPHTTRAMSDILLKLSDSTDEETIRTGIYVQRNATEPGAYVSYASA